jgi:metal-responsive CopG/Arc/MetJ family transcriptional regulator
MTVKTSVTLPDDVYNEVKKLTDNFSSVVAEALRDYLRSRKVEKALGSFGSWEERKRVSSDIVNDMRKEDLRRNANRAH